MRYHWQVAIVVVITLAMIVVANMQPRQLNFNSVEQAASEAERAGLFVVRLPQIAVVSTRYLTHEEAVGVTHRSLGYQVIDGAAIFHELTPSWQQQHDSVDYWGKVAVVGDYEALAKRMK